ncbi:MAG: hypothetical protein ACXABD_17740 [Candidatus Thorarchaeota archaeon]|jgi:hypothetical protein
MTLTIKTNNHPRQLMSGLTLDLHVGEKKAAEIRQQFDYLSDEQFENEYFITYKGYTYALCEFMPNNQPPDSKSYGWHGIHADSYFSGVLFRYVEDSPYKEVILATYFS